MQPQVLRQRERSQGANLQHVATSEFTHVVDSTLGHGSQIRARRRRRKETLIRFGVSGRSPFVSMVEQELFRIEHRPHQVADTLGDRIRRRKVLQGSCGFFTCRRPVDSS